MKKIYLITSLLIFGCSDKKNTDFDDYQLNGKVKLFVENSYEPEVKFGEIMKGKIMDSYYYKNNTVIFDKLGKKIEEKNSYAGHKIKYIYDSKGNLELKNTYDIYRKLTHQKNYKYDINGNCIETSNYENLKMTELKKIKYDKISNPIEENFYGISGKLTQKCKKEFKGNNLIKQITYTGNGDLYSVLEYKYDETGNETESIWYDALGAIQEKINYKYDSNNLVIEKISLNSWSDGRIYKWRFTYKLDENKNWVQKIVFRDDTPTPDVLVERNIIYY